MISWIIFQDDQIIDQHGKISVDIDHLLTLCNDPTPLLDQYMLQIGRHIGDSQYQIYVWRPYQQIRLTDKLKVFHPDQTIQTTTDRLWKQIPTIAEKLQQSLTIPPQLQPFMGYYGYLGYELSRHLEQYHSRDDLPDYPSLILDFPTRLLAIGDTSYYIELDLPAIEDPQLVLHLADRVEPYPGKIQHATPISAYLDRLQSIISHIRAGDIYQANYTQEFRLHKPQLSISHLYQSIQKEQQLEYGAYLNYGSLQVMSLSPELFLKIEQGVVITRPIKGTRPRGSTPEQDQQLIDELVASEKDNAELSMIVDLLRNDLGKSALPGSVNVDAHAVVESYENVHHLVSTVSATIDQSFSSSWRLLLRAFPGGSISGVPKLRALELIETYEDLPRNIYTGNIGFLGLDGDLELNIAIRTATIIDDTVTFNAGGGIVFDSDPIEEYIESLHKAKHLAHYFNHSFTGDILLCNSELIMAEQLDQELTEEGIFETILVENGQISHLSLHLARYRRGQAYYDLQQAVPTEAELHQFIRLNLATHGLYRMNIYGWRDGVEQQLVRIQSYERPKAPITLYLPKTPFVVPKPMTAGLKSLTYQSYRQAVQLAQQVDAWDSILYTANDKILEGGRCSIFIYQTSWLTPRDNVVAGTVRQQLLDHQLVNVADLTLADLRTCSALAIGNALIGILPVSKIIDHNGQIIWEASAPSLVSDLIDQFNLLE